MDNTLTVGGLGGTRLTARPERERAESAQRLAVVSRRARDLADAIDRLAALVGCGRPGAEDAIGEVVDRACVVTLSLTHMCSAMQYDFRRALRKGTDELAGIAGTQTEQTR